jgi:high affinity Mn2+ porin
MRRALLLALVPASVLAQAPSTGGFNKPLDSLGGSDPRFNLHFQTTYIYQYSGRFKNPYEGPNSLSADEERQNSLTATMYLGARLWKGGAVYLNPELAGGSGLSGALGMGGSSNGETFRVGNPAPTVYLARLYLQQTFALGGKDKRTDDGANSLPGSEPDRYLRFVVGKYSLGDWFDNNEYSNSPRTQFMNWSLMNNGAWDYAANVRGYTYALTGIFRWDATTVKGAIAALPKTANGAELSTDPHESFAVNAQVERSFKLKGREANLRLLGFHNRAGLGSYRAALNHPAFVPILYPEPDTYIDLTHGPRRSKTGVGLNFDWALGNDIGLFARAGWNDGKNETWCFTEIDRTVSAGLVATGTRWRRPDDQAGVALVANGLSKDHSDYLKAGGLGFILGDGTLTYAPEGIAELFYSAKLSKQHLLWVTGDYQFCMNPGYNADRGPANIVSLRIHVEF